MQSTVQRMVFSYRDWKEREKIQQTILNYIEQSLEMWEEISWSYKYQPNFIMDATYSGVEAVWVSGA